MDCPVCQGPMWDNNNSKFPKKEGAPNYKCKDKECKYALNRETGEYEPSEYVTGVWLPKVKKVAEKGTVALNKGTSQSISKPNDSYKTMLMSYAKDIVVAEISKGEVKEPFKRMADGYKLLLTVYANPFGKKVDAPPEDVEPF